MSITKQAEDAIDAIKPHLLGTSDTAIKGAVESGALLTHPACARGGSDKHAAFYAPFDWINDEADVVIVGMTPGKAQAATALIQLRRELLSGKSNAQAAASAKQAASFDGEMREIGAELMDHFRFHDIFRLRSSADLFGIAAHRAHYTSVFRYPVLQYKKDTKRGGETWQNFSGEADAMSKRPLLRRMVEDLLVPELRMFPNAWVVPLGKVPTEVLGHLSSRGIVDSARVLAGLNHFSPGQKNRHNCQLDRVDHSKCSPNVGCADLQKRSAQLRAKVGEILQGKLAA